MHTLQQDIEPGHGARTSDHPVFQEVTSDPAVAYAQEVRMLRQRVATLETELAATKASRMASTSQRQAPPLTTIDFAPAHQTAPAVSEFTAPDAPAVMAVQPAVETAPAPVREHDNAPESNPGFAQAWTAETSESSFEERVAEKAFFQASTVDQQSRDWLLEQ